MIALVTNRKDMDRVIRGVFKFTLLDAYTKGARVCLNSKESFLCDLPYTPEFAAKFSGACAYYGATMLEGGRSKYFYAKATIWTDGVGAYALDVNELEYVPLQDGW